MELKRGLRNDVNIVFMYEILQKLIKSVGEKIILPKVSIMHDKHPVSTG